MDFTNYGAPDGQSNDNGNGQLHIHSTAVQSSQSVAAQPTFVYPGFPYQQQQHMYSFVHPGTVMPNMITANNQMAPGIHPSLALQQEFPDMTRSEADAINNALVAAGPNLMALMVQFDAQNPNFLDNVMRSPLQEQENPVPVPDRHDLVDPTDLHHHEESPPHGDVAPQQMAEDAESLKVALDDVQVSADLGSPSTAKPANTSGLFINKASQRAARSKYWPRRSDLTSTYPPLPQHFDEYNLGDVDGHTGENSGRNLMGLFGSDSTPRTRFSLRIVRGRTNRDRRTFPTMGSYPSPDSLIPGGTSLEQICRHWPRHVWGSGLRLFMAEGWVADRIWRLLPREMRLTGNSDRPWNYIQKAMERETERIRMEDGKVEKAPKRKATDDNTVPKRRKLGQDRRKPEASGDGDRDVTQGSSIPGPRPAEMMVNPINPVNLANPLRTADTAHSSLTSAAPLSTGIVRSTPQESAALQQQRNPLPNAIRQQQQIGLELEWRLGRMVDARYIGQGPQEQRHLATDRIRGRLHQHRDRLRRQHHLEQVPASRPLDLYRMVYRSHHGGDQESPSQISAAIQQQREVTAALRSMLHEQRELNLFLQRRLAQITGSQLPGPSGP